MPTAAEQLEAAVARPRVDSQPARPAPLPRRVPGAEAILALQRTAGNAAVTSALRRAAPARRVARARTALLVNPPPGAPPSVTIGAAFHVTIDGKFTTTYQAPPYSVEFEVPKSARTVKVEGIILGVGGMGEFGGSVVARFNVEADGTLTAVEARPLPGDQTMSGATTAFNGGVTDVRPDGLDVVAEAVLDASTQSQTTTSGSSGATQGHSAQSSVTSATSASTTDETQGEDSNLLGRGIRKAVPDGWGETVLGKPDTKKHSDTTGVSSSTGTTSTVHDEDRHDQSASTTVSGPGRATTNVVRQAIVLHVTSPPRDAVSASVDVTNFGIGTAAFDDAHIGHLLKVLSDGEEPTWRERLERGRARVTLYGYASLPGTREQNQRLALDRAEAIRRHLISGGIPASAFDVAIAYGDARTPSTVAEKGGKEREDDDWRKVKVVLTEIPAGHAAAK